jgi:hypothetical protein
MARRFPDNEGAAQAFARFTYDTGETAAYAAGQDTSDEEQTILDAAHRATRLSADLCVEMRKEATGLR